ncbi:MAG: DUF2027 domain-containing protein [Prolixibacteraceae bacterium]|nr:DUF2027 domain-containing protein [Prolixibacteraceae bacterium]MBN2773095.1 DUF2027 domain-containing protein [Prolixibacteraceae bacterium]
MVRVGDKVRFLNDVGGGVVTSIINSRVVNVEGEDGFEIPTLVSELVIIESADNYDEPKQKQPEAVEVPVKKEKAESKIIKGKDKPEFFVAFVPQDQKNPVGGEIETWLVNDSNFTLMFNYSHFSGTGYSHIVSGEVAPNSKWLLESFAPFDISEFPVLIFQLIFFLKESKEMFQPIVKEIKIAPVKFYKEKTFSANSFFQQNAYLLTLSGNPMVVEFDKLTESEIQKVIQQKEKETETANENIVRKRDVDLVEVDLHINQLIDNSSELSNHEILQIQMEKFRSELNEAIQNRVKRIVFIHGVGQGTLKTEILKELKQEYKKYYVQDASFKEYGFGATMIIIRR